MTDPPRWRQIPDDLTRIFSTHRPLFTDVDLLLLDPRLALAAAFAAAFFMGDGFVWQSGFIQVFLQDVSL